AALGRAVRGPRARRRHAARSRRALGQWRLLEAQMTEIGARPIDDAGCTLAPLRPQRPEVMHLLEEGGQVLGLGDCDLVTELEQPRVVLVGTFAAALDAGGSERAVHHAEQAQLFAYDPRALGIALEPRYGRYGIGSGVGLHGGIGEQSR